jgi:ABC-type Na+ efflux pump permease subunit
LLAVNPFFWLAARDLRVPPALTGTATVACGFFLWRILSGSSSRSGPFDYVVLAAGLQLGLKLALATFACRRFIDDRRSGTLELLLVTPLSVPEILRGQWQALRRRFIGTVVVVLLFDLCLLPAALSQSKTAGPVEPLTFVLTLLASMTIFLMDLFALGWLSMWLGLTSNHAFRAISLAALLILVVPWVAFYLAFTFGMMLVLPFFAANPTTAPGSVRFFMRPEMFIGLWFLLSLAADLIFGLWARGKLYREFRARAARPIQFAKPPFLATPPPLAAVHP